MQREIKTQEIGLILNSIDSEDDVIYWKCFFAPKWYETSSMTIDRCLKHIVIPGIANSYNPGSMSLN